MSSAYASSATNTSSSASLSRPAKSPILSSGRGGSGNKRPKSVLKLDLGDEAEILQKRRLEASLNPRVKVKYTGRGGSGNIRAASVAQSIPFDISADPDDDYEQIILEGAQKAKKDKLPSTGRGGLGNFNRPRSKSFVGPNVSSKGKKEKPRRRRSASLSRHSSGTEHYELQTISTDTGSSFDIPTSRLTPAPSPTSPPRPTPHLVSSRSSLPTLPSSSSSALYSLSNRASTASLTNLSIRTSRSPSSSGLSLLPILSSTGARSVSAPNSPLRPNPHPASGFPSAPARASTIAGAAPSILIRPASQSTASLSSLPARASTSTLGLLSPPASPTTPQASPIVPSPKTSPIVSEPSKLRKARSHDSSAKWWKMGGRRRAKESVVSLQDMAPDEGVVSSPDVSPATTPVPLYNVAPEESAMAHLQEVGMHAMEVRIRMREERLSIILNSQRSTPPQPQELDDNIQHVTDNDELESDRTDPHPLPSVPEEDGEYLSFLDLN